MYSFGLTVVALAVREPILDFVGERYRVFTNKKTAPKQPMRLIRAM